MLDDPRSVGGRRAVVRGDPRPIAAPWGAAIAFDCVDDALRVDLHPLEGAREFTVEAWVRPDPGGPAEQRFLHLQESASEDRVLFETRLRPDGRWFLDTFVKTQDRGHTLFAKRHLHETGRWYHVALVVGGGRMRHFVDGELELERPIDFRPQGPGTTSIGMRLNDVSPFKGAIGRIRFTHRMLESAEFQRPSVPEARARRIRRFDPSPTSIPRI
jgi:hypothetical protein